MEKKVTIVSWDRVGSIACFLMCFLCLVFAVRPLSSIPVSEESVVSSASFMILFFVFLVLGLRFLKDWWEKQLNQ